MTQNYNHMKYLYIILLFLISDKLYSQDQYSDYLKNNPCTPSNYVEKLFINNDIVTICERDHPEMTQYDFFFELVSQQWFIKNVGNIILETATRSIQDKLDTYLLSNKTSDITNEKRLIEICRNNSIWPLWDNHNFYSFLQRIQKLNETLSPKDRIRVLGADLSVVWSKIKTKVEYQQFRESFYDRDQIMAQMVIDWHKNSVQNQSKHKALLIMNYRHAYGHIYWTENSRSKADNCHRYIKEAMPQLSTNVFLNRKTDRKLFNLRKKMNKGIWDKVFQANNYQPIGFSISNSPFENAHFDDYPYLRHHLKWKDVFDHFIFYNHTKEFYWQSGAKGLVDNDFYSELERRYKLLGKRISKRKVRMFNGEIN